MDFKLEISFFFLDQSVWTSEHHPMEANLTYDAISLDRMESLQAQVLIIDTLSIFYFKKMFVHRAVLTPQLL